MDVIILHLYICNNCTEIRLYCHGEASNVCRRDTPHTLMECFAPEINKNMVSSDIYQLKDLTDFTTSDNNTGNPINCGN